MTLLQSAQLQKLILYKNIKKVFNRGFDPYILKSHDLAILKNYKNSTENIVSIMEVLWAKRDDLSLSIALKEESTAVIIIKFSTKDQVEINDSEENPVELEIFRFNEILDHPAYYLLIKLFKKIVSRKISVKIVVFEDVSRKFIFNAIKKSLVEMNLIAESQLEIIFESTNRIICNDEIIFEEVSLFS